MKTVNGVPEYSGSVVSENLITSNNLPTVTVDNLHSGKDA